MAEGYYDDRLAADKLRQVYDTAPPRIQQYLRAEIDYVLSQIKPGATVLELGCGYGRLLPELARIAGLVVGIDTSLASLLLARGFLRDTDCRLLCMDAARPAFCERSFDYVICIQNGISAFHTNQCDLLGAALRLTRPGGAALFSSYAAAFWPDRLAWFKQQAELGLIGEIDHSRTGDGTIVCKDGFTATTVSSAQFELLTRDLSAKVSIENVDGSSLFCTLRPYETKQVDAK